VEAYDAVLRARHELLTFTPDGWGRARAYIARASEIDPAYAEPYAVLALGFFMVAMHGGAQPMREAAPLARQAAERALALDPGEPLPHFVLGAIALAHDYDWTSGQAHFTKAFDAAHVTPEARWAYASLYLHGQGLFVASSAEMRRAAGQDPLNPIWHAVLSAHILSAGDTATAIAVGRRAVELGDMSLCRCLLGEAYLAAGLFDEAVEQFELARCVSMETDKAMVLGLLAAATALAGDRTRADALIAEMGEAPRPLWRRAQFHLHVGELDAAAEW